MAIGQKYDVIDADEPEVTRAVGHEVALVDAVREKAYLAGVGAITPAFRVEERVGLDVGTEERVIF